MLFSRLKYRLDHGYSMHPIEAGSFSKIMAIFNSLVIRASPAHPPPVAFSPPGPSLRPTGEGRRTYWARETLT
jgi:hypothetical protein